MLELPPMPRRDEICRGLPAPFANPQMDRCAPSFALTPAGPVISCDSWSDRRLAILDGGSWRPVTPPGRWYREPRWADGRLLTVGHGRGDDGADCRLEVIDPNAAGWDVRDIGRPAKLGAVTGWDGVHPAERTSAGDAVALAPDGGLARVHRQPDGAGRFEWARVRLELPGNVVAQDISVAPDCRRVSLTTRGPGGVQARCFRADGHEVGGSLSEPLVGSSVWVSATRLAVMISRWPAVQPYLWDVRTGALTAVTDEGLGVCESLGYRDGLLGHTWSTPDQPRHLRLGRLGEAIAPSPPAEERTSTRVLRGADGPLPCLVQLPDGEPIGTVVLFHGGPNGSHFASWSAIAESLQEAGWRVVRPNIRGSAIRDPGLRPGLPSTYGVEDVSDALSVLRAFADSRLVVGGTSYGGYLASRSARAAGDVDVDVDGVFLIGGFLRFGDLRESDHPFTQAFLSSPRVDLSVDDEPDKRQRYLIIHGERDRRTPLGALTRNLDRLPHAELVEVPGEGHGLTTDAGALVAVPRLFDWLDRL